MARYYFDFRHTGSVTKDETAERRRNENAARNMALVALGEIARDVTLYGHEGQIAIEVRDSKSVPVLVAFTTIRVIPTNAHTDPDSAKSGPPTDTEERMP